MNILETIRGTRAGRYAVGSFSPRYLLCYGPVLAAGQKVRSPLIVMASMSEINRFIATPERVAETYRSSLPGIDVPTTLHLDHCKDFEFIKRCIDAGFESVMIDASEYPLAKNIEITAEVVRYAHARGVSVEAELGRIAANDDIETQKSDIELYTDPAEAEQFVKETGVDLLAISVGTAHGVYKTKKPIIDIERIREIRARIDTPLVLHGASGVSEDMLHTAYELPEGGVSKVNIATDLELAFLKELGADHPLTNESVKAYPPEAVRRAQAAVQAAAEEKMIKYLSSAGKAV